MIYVLELDGDKIACTSLPCVRSLLRQGWRLFEAGRHPALEERVQEASPNRLTPAHG